MKKAFLATIVALVVLVAVMNFVSASELTNSFALTIDGIDYESGNTIGIEAGETIPIKVVFTASQDADEVKLKVWIDGYRNEIKDSTGRFELVDESTYSKLFSLKVPSDIDPTEEYTLWVRIADKTDSHEEEFPLKLQRESYQLEVLNVEAQQTAVPGSSVAIEVVLKNRGMHTLDDMFVKASIPELGIEKKVYFGDIDPQDTCEAESENDDCDVNKEDAVERRIYLAVPSNAKTGVYSLEVEAYNLDFSTSTKKSIVISEEGISEILSGASAKTLNIGETVTYDLVVANSGTSLKIYNLVPEETKGLIVTVDPVVAVPAGSSTTVKVFVKATESAEEGTHAITINVKSDDELVKQVTYSANVEKGKATGTANSIVVLTIVLAIVFIVLLVVLIVLLTRKPSAVETEETSYY